MAPHSLVLLCLLCIFYTQVPKVAAAASPTKILADNLKSEKLEEARGKLRATQGQLETLKAWTSWVPIPLLHKHIDSLSGELDKALGEMSMPESVEHNSEINMEHTRDSSNTQSFLENAGLKDKAAHSKSRSSDEDQWIQSGNLASALGLGPPARISVEVTLNLVFLGFSGDGDKALKVDQKVLCFP